MAQFLLICLAGALGTGVRYLVSQGAVRLLGTVFPYGTLLVNLVGCFLICLIMHLALRTDRIGPTLRLTLTTGFLGGLTTYSSFNYETLSRLREGAWAAAGSYLLLTLLGGLAAGLLGFAAAERLG